MSSSIRIVIPACEATDTIVECVKAVTLSTLNEEAQIVVVANDGKADKYRELLDDRVVVRIATKNFSAAAARNAGAIDFKEGVVVFVDADVVVYPDTITILLEPIRTGIVQAAVGSYAFDVQGLQFAQAYKQLYIAQIYSRQAGEIKNEFWSAIGAVDAKAFHTVGGFDESTFGAGGEDTSLGFALSQAGFRIKSVPPANGKHLHAHTILGLIRNDFRKGLITIKNKFKHGTRLSDNRHSRLRDIAAVFCLGSFLLLLMLGAYFSLPAKALVFLFGVYIIMRWDIIRWYIAQGTFFTIRAVLLAMVLDCVRGLCVFVGTIQALMKRT